jgi:3-mercaptopyruvate sulfurtransferase SseA
MKKRKTNKSPILLLMAGGLLLIIAAIILLSQNTTGQIAQESSVSAGNQEEETYPDIPRVSLDEAKAAFDAGTAVFVDVRGADAFALGHIPGTLSIPLAELETRLNELDPSQWIITYCT